MARPQCETSGGAGFEPFWDRRPAGVGCELRHEADGDGFVLCTGNNHPSQSLTGGGTTDNACVMFSRRHEAIAGGGGAGGPADVARRLTPPARRDDGRLSEAGLQHADGANWLF